MAKEAILDFITGETKYIDMPIDKESFEQTQREAAILVAKKEESRETLKISIREDLKNMISVINSRELPKNTEDLKVRTVMIEDMLRKILIYLDIDLYQEN